MSPTAPVETQLIPIESQERIKKALDLFDSMRELKISNQQEYDNAGLKLVEVKSMIKGLEDDRKSIIEPYDSVTRKVNAHYKIVRDKLENGEKVFKSGRTQFFAEQERKRIEIQRKLEAETEAKRKVAEERAEAERKKADAYRQQGREDMAAKAEARAETAISVASTVVAPIVEKTNAGTGSSMTEVFRSVVENEKDTILFCLNNMDYRQCVELNVKALDKIINSRKGAIQIPGCRIVKDYRETVRV